MKNNHLVELGKCIRLERTKKGISQNDLALEAGLDRSYMGGIERGERNITFLTLCKIALCLDCDVARLTAGIPDHGTCGDLNGGGDDKKKRKKEKS